MNAQMWQESRLGTRPRHTWREAVGRYWEEAGSYSSAPSIRGHLRWLDPHFGKLMLDEITRDRIDDVRRLRLQGGVKNATVNRMLEIVRTILRRAVQEWEWIDRAPHVRLLKLPPGRVRHISVKEALTLLDELLPHLRAITVFALETGMRMGEVLRLRWSDVDLESRRTSVVAENAKNRHARAVPLSDVAISIVESLRGECSTHVFSFEGQPIKRCNQLAWRNAVKRSGLVDFRFHDLRHTWATWHAPNTPLVVLQALGGWRTTQMVQRYAHLQSDHLRAYAEKMSEGVGLGSALASQLRLGYAADVSPR